MYSCANIIYGWDLSGKDDSPIPFKNAKTPLSREKLVEMFQESEPEGFISFYSGSGGDPYAFGLDLEGFNAFGNFLTTKIPHTVSDGNKVKLKQLVDNLDDELRVEIEKLGDPQLFILWSTS